MIFTYAWLGASGSTHDSLVLAYRDPIFPKPPIGKYYLFDFGYANKRGFLAPYRRGSKEKIIYHLSEFDVGPFRDKKELFNKWHASLRLVIERIFGVWKRNREFLITCLAMTSRPKIELCIQQWFFTILLGIMNFQMLILRKEIAVVKHNKCDILKKKSLVDLKKKK
ncbi:unnamed protein product [Brassica napus]|uniref:(rape) hypothetical protein n=1 Tax=Brassica napus TaxID=3708 RepID=A0A816KKM9_BRANA|nr:unnamed protein product [Brassica napus]